jgi:hypothetical protein
LVGPVQKPTGTPGAGVKYSTPEISLGEDRFMANGAIKKTTKTSVPISNQDFPWPWPKPKPSESWRINTTFIGTGDPPSICDGKAMFELGDAPKYVTEHGFRLFNKKPHVGPYRGHFDIGFIATMGSCGPGWALASNVEGVANKEHLGLIITDWTLRAGWLFGFDVEFIIIMRSSLFKHDVFSVDKRFNYDLIRVILEILRRECNIVTSIKKVDSFDPALPHAWGIVAEKSGSLPDFSVEPSFSVGVNVWPLLLDLMDTIGIGEVLTAISDVIKATGGSIAFGPQYTMNWPTVLDWKSIIINDDVEFRKIDRQQEVWSGKAEKDLTSEPKKIEIMVFHSCIMGLEFGYYAKIKILEVFHIGHSINIPLLNLLAIFPSFDEILQFLSSTVGETSAACGQCGGSVQTAEVEFI